jgi:hypothetical protein
MDGDPQTDVEEADDSRALTSAWRGQRALGGLDRLCAPGGPRRVIDARPLARADAFTGAAVREAIDRHLTRDRGHSVLLHEPTSPKPLSMLHHLVGPLPRRARWAGDAARPPIDRNVLLPAMRVEDDETSRNVATWLETVTSGPLRLPSSAARLLAMAAATFGDNALKHGAQGVLLCACHDPQANDLQVVALSDHVPAAAVTDGVSFLREAVERSERELGGIFSIVELARRRGIDVTVRVATGTGRTFWRAGKRRYDITTAPIPAFVASVEIHLSR